MPCSCDGVAPVLTYRVRDCVSQRSPVCRSWMRLLARPPCCHAAGGERTSLWLCPSSLQLPMLTTSPHCLRDVFVLTCCSCLAETRSTESTSVCPSVVDAAPCSSTVLVVGGRGCGFLGPVCSCRVRRRVCVMVLLLSRRLVLVSAAVGVAGSDARTLLGHLAVMRLVVRIRLSRSNVQLLPPTVSSHCLGAVFV